MTCRNHKDDTGTRRVRFAWDEVRGLPVYCPSGVRHGGGVSLVWALAGNVGTRRLGTSSSLNGPCPPGGESEGPKWQEPQGAE